MADPTYTPPAVWIHDAENGGRFASINRPTAGARQTSPLPVGDHDFQLYSLATPNGVKATIMFEELLEAGYSEAEYDAWTVNISDGDQFGSGFVDLNPNSKIPTLLDRSGTVPVRVFESGAILMHLAEKFGAFLPTDHTRAEVLSWLFWQVGSAPFIGGGFGHFYAYAPEKYEYPINRYAMETKRLFDVADQRLAEQEFLGGKDYTVADIATFPWLAPFVFGGIYGDAQTFLSIHEYAHVERWVKQLAERPAVRRGRIVNKAWGEDDEQLLERHSAADFEGKTF
ncbi:glutathione-dependent disulfide-bond oxidoreductase [Qipengyuania flava]|uniref:glutathione-dependent disulfide-bond oxidoreductase n=1 Tax=Qipengyuania flava TaxID=192812 RepID=UPI001C55AB13|nr:glutathione-dependent disulfide-bond oxidoreductase [Qipengyuania flava]MBW3168128.1 glutathione-dependent disulfide-bond oxidoreductase [Qipengyuania flava]MBY5965366.1 glutathione-dependent disulfide-bond oxidoreductase [Qipengyuania flava]MBY6011690.1 glutathione-dependent disulfide-bond oxidoreductase [Qipengyuania flava]MBY6026132.1 glutathione-dependent disulfide-bond oxidoreductase [Qipengyuania flava]